MFGVFAVFIGLFPLCFECSCGVVRVVEGLIVLSTGLEYYLTCFFSCD